jgi:hypothetical protein
MEHPNAVSTLRRKYAQLAGELRANRDRAEALQADLAAVARTLQLLGDEADPAGIKPTAPPVAGTWFQHRQCTRAVLGALRDAPEPMAIGELIPAVMRACSLPQDNPRAVRATRDAVKWTLKAQRAVIVEVGDKPKRWTVAR